MAQQATVLLRNLHEASTHASVAAALAEFGPVKRVDVIRGRGFGFVKFATAADAQKAVRAGRENGIDVDGAVVEVALARDKGQKHPNAVAAPTKRRRASRGGAMAVATQLHDSNQCLRIAGLLSHKWSECYGRDGTRVWSPQRAFGRSYGVPTLDAAPLLANCSQCKTRATWPRLKSKRNNLPRNLAGGWTTSQKLRPNPIRLPPRRVALHDAL